MTPSVSALFPPPIGQEAYGLPQGQVFVREITSSILSNERGFSIGMFHQEKNFFLNETIKSCNSSAFPRNRVHCLYFSPYDLGRFLSRLPSGLCSSKLSSPQDEMAFGKLSSPRIALSDDNSLPRSYYPCSKD